MTRLRIPVPQRGDVVLMLGLLVLCLVQVIVWPIAGLPVGIAHVLVLTLPLAWLRTWTVPAFVVAHLALLIPTPDGFAIAGFLVGILLYFALGSRVMDLAIFAPAVVWGLAASTVGTLRGPDEPKAPAIIVTWVVLLSAAVFGRLVAHHRRQAEELRSLTTQLAAEREVAAQAAANEERARIARDLHDVLGHEVTLISIQAEAAALAVDADPSRARHPVEAVRATAHRAAAELRHVVAVLGDSEDATFPNPAGLSQLAERANRLGIPNTMTTSGDPWPGVPHVWAALSRILRESLTNAGKHAPGTPVDIHVAWDPDAVKIRIGNDFSGTPGTAGRGVRGMVERARLLGGSLATTHEADRFEVCGHLPRPGQR